MTAARDRPGRAVVATGSAKARAGLGYPAFGAADSRRSERPAPAPPARRSGVLRSRRKQQAKCSLTCVIVSAATRRARRAPSASSRSSSASSASIFSVRSLIGASEATTSSASSRLNAPYPAPAYLASTSATGTPASAE